MKNFKGICSVILGLALIFGFLVSTPVFAEGEEGSDSGSSEEQGSGESGGETGGGESGGGESGGGEEWSGEIKDPTPTPVPAPVPAPTPTPASTPTSMTPASNSAPASTVIKRNNNSTTTVAEDTVLPEETQPEEKMEVEPEVEPEVIVIEQKIVYPVITEMPEVMVPETANPNNVRKITLLLMLGAGIVVSVVVLAWSVNKLSKIKRFEKAYKEAVAKSNKIAKAKITRAG